MLAAAYDPSRDLSPNLPCQESSNSSGCSSTSSGASGSTSSGVCCKRDQGGVCCKQEPGGYGSCQECSPPPPQQQLQQVVGQQPPHQELVVCAGCNARITDRFYLFAVDRRWHASCLQCSQCRLPLDGEVTCFARDGSIYCKKDYYRLFGMKRCGRCQATILSSELVMRARELVFHVHCFSCAVCSTLLTKGDTFGMREGAVLCRLHYTELPPPSPPQLHHHHPFHPQMEPPGEHFQGQGGPQPPPPQQPQEFHPRLGGPPPQPPGPPPPPPDPVKMANPFFNGAPAPRQKGRPRKRKPKDLEAMTANLDLNSESAYLDVAFGPGTPGMGNGGHHQRTKRMRTSFKHHQLRTMKSYFAINHNPDAKDLKQLSQKTGLPKRVLQVWFQNARAKWRRMVLKQEGGGGGVGGGGGGKGDKCVDASGGGYHIHGAGAGLHPSPQHYLSPSPLECSS